MRSKERMVLTLLLATVVIVAAASYSIGQQLPSEGQQGAPSADPIRDLKLSPEQRERIRAIREEMRGERAAINQKLRETNQALEEVLDSDNPDDRVVEQRLRDVAEAQAASMRMRVMTEMKVRRVLTPEQVATLRTLRQNVRDYRRDRQENNELRRRERVNRRGLPERNTIAPILPRLDSNRRPRP